MNFKKIIWKLFKINRNDFNNFDSEVEALLIEVYKQGKLDGQREERKFIQSLLKPIGV